jgi:hypothetical protein
MANATQIGRKNGKASKGAVDGVNPPASIPAVALAAATVVALSSPAPETAGKEEGKAPTADKVLSTVTTNAPPAPEAQGAEQTEEKPEGKEDQEEREKAAAAAEIRLNRLGSALGERFRAKFEKDSEWMIATGKRCAEYLVLAEAFMNARQAMDNLATRILIISGENVRAEITRCLQIYYASEHFGAERFKKLPITGQKAFGSCMEGTEELPQGSRNKYAMKVSLRERAEALFPVCAGEVKLPPALVPVFGDQITKKTGCLTGAAISALVSTMKEGRDPLTPASKEEKGKEENKGATAGSKEETKAPAGENRPVEEEEEEEEEEEVSAEGPSATNKRPEGPGGFKLDVKPEIAAASVVQGLLTHDNPNAILYAVGRAKEIRPEMLEFLIAGMAEHGRFDELRRMAQFIGKELQIANWLAANPGKNRVEALEIYQREGRLTTSKAA